MTPSTRSRTIAIVTGCILALALLVIFRKSNATSALRAELAAMQAQAAEAARLQTELERLRGTEAEAKRLRDENREVPRLRGDVARLRRELLAATNQSARPMPTHDAASASGSVNETNSATFTGTARASLAPGQTLVMGGWPLEPGKRTLALFTPNAALVGQPGGILVGSIYVQVPESLLSGPGWEPFAAVLREANTSGVFDAEQTKKFIEALQKMEGVDFLSSPRLLTTSGGAASISVGDANGSGLNTSLVPVLAADGQTVDLTVSNSLRNLPPAAGGQRP